MNNTPPSSGDSTPPADISADVPDGAASIPDRQALTLAPSEVEDDLTPPDDASPKLKELRNRQRLAFVELALGRTIACASARAGVHRRTVHRWLREDEDFMAALDAVREGTMQLVRRQLLAAAPRAAARVAEACDSSDGKMALLLLKHLGAFGDGAAAAQDAQQRQEQDSKAYLNDMDSDPMAREMREALDTIPMDQTHRFADIIRLGTAALKQ
ncbi:MAG: hypothetical protein JWO87_1519 [Phycisphaerales bacterium]|nr:hypothetical protein [Phycisphaerales bacterium]